MEVANSTMDTLTSTWSLHSQTNRVLAQGSNTLSSTGKNSSRHGKRHSMSSNQNRARQIRPRSIQLPSQEMLFEDVPLSTPSLQTSWSKGSSLEPLMTPVDSPEGMYGNFWTAREGSVISSTSSTDSRERVSSFMKHGRLERPFVGLPKDSRERCMSVSLVVGADGTAQVQREEVEVEFLENQKELGLGSAMLMKRMVSSAGSDVSVSRNFNSMSLVNSTRGEVLVRSASQQTDLSHSIPLTPSLSESFKFVSPDHLKRKNVRPSMQRSASTSMLRTPDSFQWNDSDEETEEDDLQAAHVQDENDAQAAVQKLFDRKKGKVAQGFVGSTMPTSPLARAHRSQNSLACGACQIVFRSSAALANHTPRCSVKQTPFASADFFETLDMFGMSSDLMFMADLNEETVKEPISPLPFNALLDSAFCGSDDIHEPASDLMTPRKRSRFDRLRSLSPTPTPAQSTPMHSTIKRKR